MLFRLCVVTLVWVAACGFPMPADVGDDDPDFTVVLDSARVRVVEGESTSVGVTLGRNAFSDPVTVTVAGLPAGVTADLLTITANTGTLTLRASAGATQGNAALTVTATGGARSYDAPLSLLAMGLPGTLDRSFGLDGMLPTPLGRGEAIAIQPDGKIVVAGPMDGAGGSNAVRRYLASGAIDTSFSSGTALLDGYLNYRRAMALQPDGKILVAEATGNRSSVGRLVRLNADGTLDSDFGDGGRKVLELNDPGHSTVLYAIAVQPNGGIVVAGATQRADTPAGTWLGAVVRLTDKGAFDNDFGTAGRVIVAEYQAAMFLGLAQLPDGRLLAIGQLNDERIAFARFDKHGGLDGSFNTFGYFAIEYKSTLPSAALALQPDGSIVGASGRYLVRLNGAYGSRDSGFGSNGVVTMNLVGDDDFATGLALQSDGKFVVVGGTMGLSNPIAYVARFGIDGQFDRTFAGGAIVPFPGGTSAFQAMAQDTEGRIVATGYRGRDADEELTLCRFWP
jgi:uncharacterized delta-60 repeat protein